MKPNRIFSGIILFVVASSAYAGLIPVSEVTASSTFYSYSTDNLVSGSGLSGNTHDGNWENKWLANETVTGTLVFNFGSIFDISSSSIWNYGGGCCGTTRSVKDLGIEASLDGITYSSIGSFILNQSTDPLILADTIFLDTTAQYIKFNLNSNYGANYTGLSEVQFNGVAASVSEPTSIALLTLGLAGIGFSRKKNAN
ncbi:PEP-CTERM sorting domain-containing protein [Paraglaciecola chathamensis]|jgi:hypothetical protein|uniref:Ice-binding protein C-terminal domain-containing protein n=2 Tax=Paraglaciecola chathamensis TaxID=368405 RepID=A0A8H9IB85_9ALTE|nr:MULTISPECIES: PEP-CTERM sorting domain-containing protein [Paraglaciecola]AEE22473.1 protein of unknown function DUF1555 [Glaciecola sp. 4H-3-7+YE-5]GAC09216.1 hypothetical protein GCHA_1255 [Paraglaciecola chathamensis S18K6]GGZ54637.1 hypothetical protein GCM10011274_10740 [Paraglaciecola oceanifecundans]